VKWAPDYDYTGMNAVSDSDGAPLSGSAIDIGAYEYYVVIPDTVPR